jgi:hypothetical protein
LCDPTIQQQQLITRAALLGAMVADLETRWVAGEQINLGDYLATVNTQRRVLATLGLERRSKDVTSVPTAEEYFARKQKLKEEANKREDFIHIS